MSQYQIGSIEELNAFLEAKGYPFQLLQKVTKRSGGTDFRVVNIGFNVRQDDSRYIYYDLLSLDDSHRERYEVGTIRQFFD